MRKLKVAAIAVAATSLALMGTAVAHASTQTPASVSASTHLTPKLDPFTGKMTTQYVVKACPNGPNTTYYFWRYSPSTNYCVYDDGGASGAPVDMYSTCNSHLANDVWTPVYQNSGDWIGSYRLEDEAGLCVDDINGADNVRLRMEPCAEIGGQSWGKYLFAGFGDLTWINEIRAVKGDAVVEVTTDDNGDLVPGAWVVSNAWNATGNIPVDITWHGPEFS